MHLRSVTFHGESYPTQDRYPFSLPLFQKTDRLVFDTAVTLFVGENGAGKSTLLEAMAHRCGIHIWQDGEHRRVDNNPFEDRFQDYISVEWVENPVPGSYFGSQVFQDFVRILDDWAAASPALLNYFGGRSLVTQSHGQSIMSFFRSRYGKRGLYLLDEPETALSPKTQLELLGLLTKMGRAGHAQFVVATHSPILLACPDARIFSFDHIPIESIEYEDTDHYRVFKGFMEDRQKYISAIA